jgi:NAD(P)-dependent dehydrogenase (short-subunit alcohol dehydrogenase family)
MEPLSALSCLATGLALLLLGLWLWKEVTMGLYTGGDRLDGRLVVITGGNCGIGLEVGRPPLPPPAAQTARELARRGALLVVGCRSKARGEAAVRDIVASTGSRTVELVELDLLSLASVRRFAQAVASRPEPLHLLINNAGAAAIMNGSRHDGRSHLSGDGLEVVTQTNHLSHFLLTCLLRDRLAAAGTSRVINVSSLAALHGKIDLQNINYETDSSSAALKKNYHNSKLMNVMFSAELSRRWKEQGVTSFSCHPGLVR